MEIVLNVKIERQDLEALASKEGSEVFRTAISLLSSLGVPVNVKPVDVKPVEAVKPVADVKDVKPAVDVKPVDVKPVEAVKPVADVKDVKPAVDVKPVEFNRNGIMNELKVMAKDLPDLRQVIKDELPKYGAIKLSGLTDENLKKVYERVKEHEARVISA